MPRLIPTYFAAYCWKMSPITQTKPPSISQKTTLRALSNCCHNGPRPRELTERTVIMPNSPNEKKVPKNAEKVVRIPQRKCDAQADVTYCENCERVGHGPETSGEQRPNDQVRRASNIGADGRGAQDQRGQAPARKKNANDHDERNDHRRNANGNELGRSFRGAEPGSRGEAGKNTEQLKFFRARGVLDGRLKF